LAVVLGCGGAFGGVLAILITGHSADPHAWPVWLNVTACLVALVGAGLVGLRRSRWGATLLLEALVGLWLGLREAALIPDTLLLSAAIFALLAGSGRH
jgi:hypothetical protein